MKNRYSSIERMAGIFVVCSFALAILLCGIQAARQGWFEPRVHFQVYLTQATDIREGTAVEIAGLPVGRVNSISLQQGHRILVDLAVRKSYATQITQGTQARLLHPFLIGERKVELIPAETSTLLAANSEIPLLESADPMDLLRGSSLAESIAHVSSLLRSLDGLAGQLNSKGELTQTVANLSDLTRQIRRVLPFYTSHAPEMGKDVAEITRNMAALTSQVNQLMPMINETAKSAPESARVIGEALHETSILVKALQRSFLIRGNVEEVRKEEAERKPASANPTTTTPDHDK